MGDLLGGTITWLSLRGKNIAFLQLFSLFNHQQSINKPSCIIAHCHVKVTLESVTSKSKQPGCHSFWGSEVGCGWPGSLCLRGTPEIAKNCWLGQSSSAHLMTSPLLSTLRIIWLSSWWLDHFSFLLAMGWGFSRFLVTEVSSWDWAQHGNWLPF